MKRLLLVITVALTVAATLGVVAFGSGGMGSMGRSGSVTRPAFRGFYDGHKDTFLSTDISDKSQAAEMHVNYSAILKKVPMGATDDIYLIQGPSATGQIPVFGSEPGEPTYTPLWHEVLVTWKSGATPVLLVKDDQITTLAKQGRLTIHDPHIVLNAPITNVGSKQTVT